MRDRVNVKEYFKPGERMRMMYYSVSDMGKLGKKGNLSAPIRSLMASHESLVAQW